MTTLPNSETSTDIAPLGLDRDEFEKVWVLRRDDGFIAGPKTPEAWAFSSSHQALYGSWNEEWDIDDCVAEHIKIPSLLNELRSRGIAKRILFPEDGTVIPL